MSQPPVRLTCSSRPCQTSPAGTAACATSWKWWSLADSAALQWALRDFPNARYETALSPTESPPVVITEKGADEPRLAQQYRGQDFVWRLYPGWQGAFPPDFINWLAFRQAPLAQEQIILWARTDIFPGGGSERRREVSLHNFNPQAEIQNGHSENHRHRWSGCFGEINPGAKACAGPWVSILRYRRDVSCRHLAGIATGSRNLR